MSQDQLASLTGIPQPSISRIESATYDNHSLRLVRKIAKALNADVHLIILPRN